jgi:hypothetical protein
MERHGTGVPHTFRNQTDAVMRQYDLEWCGERGVDNDHCRLVLLAHSNGTHLLVEAQRGHDLEFLRSAFGHEKHSELGETWATRAQGRGSLGYPTTDGT